MSKFHRGEMVAFRCVVAPGAFPKEFLITANLDSKDISGFVREDQISSKTNGHAFLHGRVVDVTTDCLSLLVRGSFFSSNGFFDVSPNWATQNLRRLD
jgi:hypothetical protein